MDDPRFKHVATDPRFKAIPKRARKVRIDSRFQSMFTDKKFKVKYAVDRRGRKVKQSSSEDLRKYYDLDDEETRAKGKVKEKEQKQENSDKEHTTTANEALTANSSDIIADSGDSPDDITSESDSKDSDNDDSSSSTDIEDFTFDLTASASEGVVHGWGEVAKDGRVPHSEETSHRLAVCNMDWDRLSANDIFVLLSSFKPRGGSIIKVSIYPSDFGLERLAREEREGPSELLHHDSEDEGVESSDEGHGYSTEKLRSYQLNRLKYYYAVVECDSKTTAEVIYEQCDGLEYECSGGQVDLRFIPDDVTFDDREPKSVATESSIPANFTPSNFVNTALQQSKVEMTWDETDPKRLQTTMRKFTKEDVQSMDFGAYLASSSSEGSDSDEGEGTSGYGQKEDATEEEKIQKYKALLEECREDKGQNGAEEEMEITWEPGLNETAKDLMKKKTAGGGRGGVGETTWEKYLEEKKQKRKGKRSKVKETHPAKGAAAPGGEGVREGEDDVGFDDPFFQHDVTTATAKSKKAKRSKLSQEELERDKKEKSELELLMLENGEEESSRQHFNLTAIMKEERDSNKKQQRRQRVHQRKKGKRGRATEEEKRDTVPPGPLDDGFQIDLNDPRFSALYESHLYAPDPANPLYKATKAMESIMKERQKRSHHRSTLSKLNSISESSSIVSLVKSVKSKSSSFKEKKRKRKNRETDTQL